MVEDGDDGQLESGDMGSECGGVGCWKAFAPLLGTDSGQRGKPGRIVNISSVAGKRAFPFQGPYAASKHGLEAVAHARGCVLGCRERVASSIGAS